MHLSSERENIYSSKLQALKSIQEVYFQTEPPPLPQSVLSPPGHTHTKAGLFNKRQLDRGTENAGPENGSLQQVPSKWTLQPNPSQALQGFFDLTNQSFTVVPSLHLGTHLRAPCLPLTAPLPFDPVRSELASMGSSKWKTGYSLSISPSSHPFNQHACSKLPVYLTSAVKGRCGGGGEVV